MVYVRTEEKTSGVGELFLWLGFHRLTTRGVAVLYYLCYVMTVNGRELRVVSKLDTSTNISENRLMILISPKVSVGRLKKFK